MNDESIEAFLHAWYVNECVRAHRVSALLIMSNYKTLFISSLDGIVHTVCCSGYSFVIAVDVVHVTRIFSFAFMYLWKKSQPKQSTFRSTADLVIEFCVFNGARIWFIRMNIFGKIDTASSTTPPPSPPRWYISSRIPYASFYFPLHIQIIPKDVYRHTHTHWNVRKQISGISFNYLFDCFLRYIFTPFPQNCTALRKQTCQR